MKSNNVKQVFATKRHKSPLKMICQRVWIRVFIIKIRNLFKFYQYIEKIIIFDMLKNTNKL